MKPLKLKLAALAALAGIMFLSAAPASAGRNDRDTYRDRYERHDRRFDHRHDRGWRTPRRDWRADYYGRPVGRGFVPGPVYNNSPNQYYGRPGPSYYNNRPYNTYRYGEPAVIIHPGPPHYRPHR